jgi:hypothetical protein
MPDIETVLLLYSDRAEPATAAVLDHAARFGRKVVARSVAELVEGTGLADPDRTAVINRIGSLGDEGATGPIESPYGRQKLWTWLHRELQRFPYASSLPTATSPIGGFGSLRDQWADLPRLAEGLRVPIHGEAAKRHIAGGDVHVVDPRNLYTLGQPLAAGATWPQGATRLAYVRPRGTIVHAAQVGGMMMFTNAPPDMARSDSDRIAAFAEAMARSSESRILEHAFFVGDGPPVFYSTFPLPIVSGRHPAYAELVVEGLTDDISRLARRLVA